MARAKRHVGKPAAAPEASTALEDKVQREPNKLKKVLLILGPGLITGASDDDPSGIGTYAVAGASFGFATLWTALFTFPLMTTTQVACARIAHVTGRGIAGVLRHYYGRWLLMPVVLALFVANTLNAGADLGAIAAAINLLVPVPIAAMIVPIALLIVALQFVGSYQMIAATFKWLTLVLLAYVAASAYARPGAFDVIRHTFVPTMRFNREFIAVIVAILGTTISPYLWFWQASEEIEEEIAQGRTTIEQRKGASASEKRLMVVDTSIGMFVSNVVMYFIILTTAATLFTAGKTDIASAADAAEALRPLAGDFATVLLAVGLIGSGLLAIPILTGSAAYAASEGFGWRFGLDRGPHQAKQFYGVIAASTLAGMLINFTGINPIDALFWTAVINGLLAPPLLAVIMLIGSNREIMGTDRNGPLINTLGWLTVITMAAAAAAFLWTL